MTSQQTLFSPGSIVTLEMPVGVYLDYINWGNKTCPLWAVPLTDWGHSLVNGDVSCGKTSKEVSENQKSSPKDFQKCFLLLILGLSKRITGLITRKIGWKLLVLSSLYDVQREHNCIVRKFNLFSTPTLGWSLDEEPGPAHVVQVTLKLSQ